VILVVSALTVADESALLDPIAPLQDDDVSKELLDATSAEELGVTADENGAASEELDSSTALLSPPSGPELLESSPQAIRPAHAKQANTTENFES
jgi:hypothetical protein